ncbi:MAG: hypothetical protein KJ583_00405 [Nanoarchaeota archaeon]|nr:hypothetical protein [Nanoarchaeota archaeon]MBU1269047.1 hypothetical protein [Nanoarchaeota archaeon]MBU1603750.1 hypothetical protein [Nanoarchaeota archaeon]MBU2443521.1 hypothetical protein [Nanoarchaeota archaeon]
MKNKGPIVISYLALIILVMILFQVTGFLKILALTVMIITTILMFQTINKESSWKFESWYSLFALIIILLFILANTKSTPTSTTQSLLVGIILLLMVGFFLTSFSKENKKGKKRGNRVIKIVELKKPEKPFEETEQPQIEVEMEVFDVTHDFQNKSEKDEPKKEDESKDIFVSTKQGLTYHKPDCGYMKKTAKSNIKMYVSKGQAEAMGLIPCRTCIN